MSIQAKILSLKVELENDIKSWENQALGETTSVGYNNIQILIGEKKRMVEKLINILN